MDRVVTYIPKLLNEVEELTIRKKKLAEAIESEKSQRLERQDPQTRAISVLELGESGDEVVVQISMKKEKEDEFSNLLNVMEMQGSSILSASTSLVCRDQRVVCYNLHVKKKWCAPSIMDRVVTYIPKLLNEVEELTIRKKKLAEAIESEKSQRLERQDPQTRAISVLELGESGDEVVVQISMKKEKEDEFSNLLNVMEMQGSSILSASTSLVCRHQRVVCYNLHVKMDEKPCEGDDYITVLKNITTSSLS
ncbi:hypothetical protein F2Q70_00045244 [Brassica cretica]|uniref:Uncharacterized protein n=1 Tax=Brassica cretica TaxID=69181 RepID=A0A8S9KAV5_BRACR|nr:hypothetical protein F2Q70_00045244 [Brassica cretica]